jgi:hypothetical protein
MELKSYRLALGLGLFLAFCLLVTGHDAGMFVLGLIWLMLMIGHMHESVRFTDLFKAKYPADFRALAKGRSKLGTMRALLTFSPPADPELEAAQVRMKHWLFFIRSAFILSAVVLFAAVWVSARLR